MTPDEATAVANEMTEYPRRMIRVTPSGPHHVTVECTITDGFDSSDAPSFLTPLRPIHRERFDCSRWTSDRDVVRAVIETEMAQWEHELREFHRLHDGRTDAWRAPFHPHTADGVKAWARGDRSAMERDLSYNTRG